MKIVTLPSRVRVPALGQGTWYMGENRATHGEEIATLRLGLDLGITLIDTTEMYGEGKAGRVYRRGNCRQTRRGLPGEQSLYA